LQPRRRLSRSGTEAADALESAWVCAPLTLRADYLAAAWQCADADQRFEFLLRFEDEMAAAVPLSEAGKAMLAVRQQ
jgi:hypothetical protein